MNTSIRANSINALGKIGPEAKKAIPHLIQAINDPSPFVRTVAIEALSIIAPESKKTILALNQAVNNFDTLRYCRTWYCRDALGKIGPEAKKASSALIQAINDQESKQNTKQRHLSLNVDDYRFHPIHIIIFPVLFPFVVGIVVGICIPYLLIINGIDILKNGFFKKCHSIWKYPLLTAKVILFSPILFLALGFILSLLMLMDPITILKEIWEKTKNATSEA